jgi:hypothetical protein
MIYVTMSTLPLAARLTAHWTPGGCSHQQGYLLGRNALESTALKVAATLKPVQPRRIAAEGQQADRAVDDEVRRVEAVRRQHSCYLQSAV